MDLSDLYKFGKNVFQYVPMHGMNGGIMWDAGWYASGGKSAQNAQESNKVQIDYENYLKEGNKRALDDWNKNVGYKGRTIRYPELSYAGQIRRADTSVARNVLDYSTAGANYIGSVFKRASGLYGVGGRSSRTL